MLTEMAWDIVPASTKILIVLRIKLLEFGSIKQAMKSCWPPSRENVHTKENFYRRVYSKQLNRLITFAQISLRCLTAIKSLFSVLIIIETQVCASEEDGAKFLWRWAKTRFNNLIKHAFMHVLCRGHCLVSSAKNIGHCSNTSKLALDLKSWWASAKCCFPIHRVITFGVPTRSIWIQCRCLMVSRRDKRLL